MLSSVDLVLAQSEEQAERFVSLGMPPSKVVKHGEPQVLPRGRRSARRAVPGRTMVTSAASRRKSFPSCIPSSGARPEFPGLRLYVAPREMTLIATIERTENRGDPLFGDEAGCAGDTAGPAAATRIARRREGPGPPAKARMLVLVDTVGDLVGHIRGRASSPLSGGASPPTEDRTSSSRFLSARPSSSAPT